MRKRLLFLLVLTIFSTLCRAQISGTVFSHRGTPLPDATLHLEGTASYTLSDSSGRFRFPAAAAGKTYEISVSHAAYGEQTVTATAAADKDIRILMKQPQADALVVKAHRAGSRIPQASDDYSGRELRKISLGQDIPVLLNNLPSVVSTSDAGAGVGYTGIRIRGSDGTRINVTANGIPLNDAESHSVFWVNMPDFSSSVQNLQVQRGTGTSTNGTGSFGGAIHMLSSSNSDKPNAEISSSGGSFGTGKVSIGAGTGLINNKFSLQMRLSGITSNGFLDRAASKLQSRFIAAEYREGKHQLRALHFGGSEWTYQAWYGVPESRVNGNTQQLADHYKRNVGTLYLDRGDSLNLFNSDRRYNYYTYRNETDNYRQDHYQLHYNYSFSENSVLTFSLNHTYGRGYFEQNRRRDALSKYNIDPVIRGTDTIYYANLVRQRWLKNTFNGGLLTWKLKRAKTEWSFGSGVFYYNGIHFGRIIWSDLLPQEFMYRNYYNANGTKLDANAWGRAELRMNTRLLLWGELQGRKVDHRGRGQDNDLRTINFNGNYTFYNPRAGLSWDAGSGNSLYVSVAMVSKEPSRSDFTDRVNGQIPKPEKLTDIEGGWQYRKGGTTIQANAYFMKYRDQLIITGKLNDVGTALRVNVPNSYRAGIELSAFLPLTDHFSLNGNLTLSDNRISKFSEEITDYSSYNVILVEHRNTPIAMSPKIISAVGLQYSVRDAFSATLITKYVGKQYLDNTGRIDRSLPAYQVTDLRLNAKPFRKYRNLELNTMANNIFNVKYSSNGYTYSYIYIDKITENYLYPQAGINFLAGLTLRF